MISDAFPVGKGGRRLAPERERSDVSELGYKLSGAPGPIRTADTRFRRAVLCPLSYGGAYAVL